MNLDFNKRFPSQILDGDPTECVGLSVSDIAGNLIGIPCDPDYSYAMALHFAGSEPQGIGSDPLAGIAGALWYGVLPEALDTSDAKDKGELYVANWQNYSKEQIAGAIRMNGLRYLNSYDAIVDHIQTYKSGVSLPMKLYQEFTSPDSSGVLTLNHPNSQPSNHNVAVYDVTDKGLLFKPWLGKIYGDGGYGYMTRDIYNKAAYTAYAFDMNATRLSSLIACLGISLQYLSNYLANAVKGKPTP